MKTIRFLKKDQSSGRWEVAGEDTAREKASQVLRDAVAQLEESRPSDDPQSTAVHPAPAPVPSEVVTSVHVARRARMSDEATPALQSVTSSWSSSTPRSHESPERNKRRRLSLLSPQASSPYYSYPTIHDSILHSPVRVDPWQHQSVTYPGGHYSFPTMPHPPRLPSQQSAPLSPPLVPYHYSQPAVHFGRHLQTASARRLSIGSNGRPLDPLDPNFNDFDLFPGDFLESDLDEIIHSNQHPF